MTSKSSEDTDNHDIPPLPLPTSQGKPDSPTSPGSVNQPEPTLPDAVLHTPGVSEKQESVEEVELTDTLVRSSEIADGQRSPVTDSGRSVILPDIVTPPHSPPRGKAFIPNAEADTNKESEVPFSVQKPALPGNEATPDLKI